MDKTKSQIRCRLKERVIGSWRSVGECARRGQTLKKSRQWTCWAPLQIQKKMSRHHDTNPTHTLSVCLSHATHTHTQTHTQRSIRVGYMSDPYTQVHDVQLTSDSQLIGQIKQWIKKKSNNKRNHNSASIKWPLSRSTYQHFLGCWLIDKCCQSHTENKTKQKLQNGSIFFSQKFFCPFFNQWNIKPSYKSLFDPSNVDSD